MIHTITITMTITITITIIMMMIMMMMVMMTMTMTMTIDLPDGCGRGYRGYIYLSILQLDQMKGEVTAEYI